MLLEEAYNYKTIKKDKNGLSGAFKVGGEYLYILRPCSTQLADVADPN